MEFVLLIMVLALNCAVRSCVSTTSSSTYGIGINGDGTFRFPVFHKNHPSFSSLIQTSDIPEASFSRDDSLRENVFFVSISLGTPAVSNLVTIDTGSSLSWVQCGHCGIHCHWQAGSARAMFNPFNSSTYQSVSCSAEACHAIHKSIGITSICPGPSVCLYRIQYALGEYSVGYLGKEKLSLPNNLVVDDFIFGCGGDNIYNGLNGGVIGFRDESYSFFNQVAQQANYRAFSYCFPSNHENEGFLSIGPYVRDERLMLTRLISYGNLPFYAIQQLDMMVNGISLEIDQRIYSTAVTIIDSGNTDTFILSPVFHALDKAMTTAMLAKGYVRGRAANKICFVTTGDSINWNDLPAVEMKFGTSTLVLRMENLFYVNTDDSICLTFQPDDAIVRGVQILGNKALRSFRVVYDIQDRIFGFQAGAC